MHLARKITIILYTFHRFYFKVSSILHFMGLKVFNIPENQIFISIIFLSEPAKNIMDALTWTFPRKTRKRHFSGTGNTIIPTKNGLSKNYSKSHFYISMSKTRNSVFFGMMTTFRYRAKQVLRKVFS